MASADVTIPGLSQTTSNELYNLLQSASYARLYAAVKEVDPTFPVSDCISSLHMIAAALSNNILHVKFIYKRILFNPALASTSIITAVHRILKFIFTGDLPQVHLAVRHESDVIARQPTIIRIAVQHLTNFVINKQIDAFASQYSTVSLQTVTSALAISDNDALELVRTRGWNVERDDKDAVWLSPIEQPAVPDDADVAHKLALLSQIVLQIEATADAATAAVVQQTTQQRSQTSGK